MSRRTCCCRARRRGARSAAEPPGAWHSAGPGRDSPPISRRRWVPGVGRGELRHGHIVAGRWRQYRMVSPQVDDGRCIAIACAIRNAERMTQGLALSPDRHADRRRRRRAAWRLAMLAFRSVTIQRKRTAPAPLPWSPRGRRILRCGWDLSRLLGWTGTWWGAAALGEAGVVLVETLFYAAALRGHWRWSLDFGRPPILGFVRRRHCSYLAVAAAKLRRA